MEESAASEAFESSIDALDTAVIFNASRTADNTRRLRAATKRPRGEEPPFHEPEDSFNAAIEAVSALARVNAPTTMNLKTEPQIVYNWIVEAMISFGNECRAEGALMERSAETPRIPNTHARVAIQLMEKLNAALSMPPTAL